MTPEPGPAASGRESPPGLPFAAAMVVYGVVGLGAAGWMLAFGEGEPSPVVIPGGRALWYAVLLGLALGGATVVLSVGAERALPPVRRLAAFLREATAHLSTGQRIQLGVVSAVAEELLFRGVLLPVVGVVGSSALFAVLHVGPRGARLVWMGFAFIMGLFFAGLTLYTGSLLAAAIAHAAVNVVNLLRLGATPAAAPDVGNHHRGSGRVRADR